MRGKLSDQDLSDYALNDGLSPQERLYVESMLGLSEECRSDVYQMMDLGQMLEEGFERENVVALPQLREEQRHALLNAPVRGHSLASYLRQGAAAISLAACVALVLANPQAWEAEGQGSRALDAVSAEVSRMVSTMKPAVDEDYDGWIMPTFAEDASSDLMQASTDSMPDETICTPPTWQVDADLAGEQSQIALP